MTDTYTREQIVRKLKRMRRSYMKTVKECKYTPKACPFCRSVYFYICAFDEVIAAFKKGKAGK